MAWSNGISMTLRKSCCFTHCISILERSFRGYQCNLKYGPGAMFKNALIGRLDEIIALDPGNSQKCFSRLEFDLYWMLPIRCMGMAHVWLSSRNAVPAARSIL